MADHPALFQPDMIRALLREAEHPGAGKTQTRRANHLEKLGHFGKITEFGPSDTRGYDWHFRGKQMLWNDIRHERLLEVLPWHVGDRLWVRETVACGACAPGKPSHWAPSFWRREQGSPSNPAGLWYAADGLAPERQITDRGRWVPSIHMPRWASRITLIVTEVRVQRLQEISEEDAEAEGIERDPETGGYWGAEGQGLGGATRLYATAVLAYADLWRHINGSGSWEANPWVVAYTFARPILKNIDEV